MRLPEPWLILFSLDGDVSMPKSKAPIGGYIAGAITFWTLALYVFLTGDPTRILVTDRFAGQPIDPTRVASTFVLIGAGLFCVALWKRFGQTR